MADNKKHIVILVICTDIFYRLIKCISKSNLDFRTATFNYENIESELAHKAFNSEIIYLKELLEGKSIISTMDQLQMQWNY